MVNTLFSVSSIFVMPFWFLMIVLPHWRWTQRIIASPWIAIGPAAIYIALIAPILPEVLPPLLNPTLPGIAALLGSPTGATLAWVHFLAFDLLAARWAYRDSRRLGVSAWLVSPCLFAVLMVGPLGFTAYLAVRTVYGLVKNRDAQRLGGAAAIGQAK